ncbi:MAG: SHOCT domain-containing protein [Actinomycetia bacterium]|nr:SHOCT domain-containing protein [Actinomycetes bacterium]
MMFWYDHDMGWWGYAGMGIGMLLFWTLIIVGIVALIRLSFRTANTNNSAPTLPTTHSPSAEEVLANRFARGDIDETEYRQRMAVILSHTRP